ncbi:MULTISPECIES: ANTAR domain-containing protein [Nocardiaceae]|uniref:ANTAR domain-containing protein n=1 Tax=Nocardiaceae TaxID=85025 RepID=UPI001E5C7AC3|nr:MULTISPECIES: ANTAR domain-containing protein [Rhodococcus]
MTERNPETTVSRGPASRSDVDIATGVLVGRCGVTVTAAVNDLFATARDNRVSLFELARTVITIAEGRDSHDSESRRIALARWGHVLAPGSVAQSGVSA